MGYGEKHPGPWNKSAVLTWKHVENGAEIPNLEAALDIWQAKLGITFQESQAQSTSFVVKTVGAKCTGWSRPVKVLSLQVSDTLGTCLHEIGHLLGISHEQDRDELRKGFYTDGLGKDLLFGLEGANSRAAKLVNYDPHDPASIMQYPESHYLRATEPSDGDVATAKAINGWA